MATNGVHGLTITVDLSTRSVKVVETIKHNPDLELVAVFTRRAPETVKILTETAAVYSVNDAEKNER